MAKNRYNTDLKIKNARQYDSARAFLIIRRGIRSGLIRYKTKVLNGAERLDIIAGKEYNDDGYSWLIAAASDIGWQLQVPPGTFLRIPVLEDVNRLLG